MLQGLSTMAATARGRFRPAGQRFGCAVEGMAAIEMALIFPVMLVIYFGLVDVTNLLSANRRVTLAASTLADLITQAPGTVIKADLTGFYKAMGPIMDPFPSDIVGVQIEDYQKVGNAPTLRWKNNSNGGVCAGSPSTANIGNLMTAGNDVVIARVCIRLTPLVGKVIGTAPFKLEDQLTLRPRQSTTITCADC